MAKEAKIIVRPRRHMNVELSRWSTILLIFFMMSIPFFGRIDPSGAMTHFLTYWLFIVFIGYMSIQFSETATRSSADGSGFFADNGIALVAVLVGFAILILLVSGNIRMNMDQIQILLQCLGWGGLDFVFGILISRSIAASAKERDETA